MHVDMKLSCSLRSVAHANDRMWSRVDVSDTARHCAGAGPLAGHPALRQFIAAWPRTAGYWKCVHDDGRPWDFSRCARRAGIVMPVAAFKLPAL